MRPWDGGVTPGKDLDQGGLAGPVLAEQRVHLACAQAEVHDAEGVHGAVGLGHAGRVDQVRPRPPRSSGARLVGRALGRSSALL
jgi:hypothetical protein